MESKQAFDIKQWASGFRKKLPEYADKVYNRMLDVPAPVLTAAGGAMAGTVLALANKKRRKKPWWLMAGAGVGAAAGLAAGGLSRFHANHATTRNYRGLLNGMSTDFNREADRLNSATMPIADASIPWWQWRRRAGNEAEQQRALANMIDDTHMLNAYGQLRENAVSAHGKPNSMWRKAFDKTRDTPTGVYSLDNFKSDIYSQPNT
jgi:hypothetical protein